jgi:hypothetical protein
MKLRFALASLSTVGALASCGGGSTTVNKVESNRVVLPAGGSRVKATAANGTVSFDFGGLPLDRELHMQVGKSDGKEFVFVGYFEGDELPGRYETIDARGTKPFALGKRSGPGPDTFATAGLTSGEYVACVSPVPASANQLVCAEFTIG